MSKRYCNFVMMLDDGTVSVVDVAVESPVQIDAVTPDIGCAGNTEQVVITGTGFTPDMAVSFGEGITVEALDIQSGSITADIAVSATAGLGIRAISVGNVVKENAFTVIDIQVIGDNYVPLSIGETALLQANISPLDALTGREMTYYWQVTSGTGFVTQTGLLSTEYVPNTVETALISFALTISGTTYLSETEVNVWDFDFAIESIATASYSNPNKPSDIIQANSSGEIPQIGSEVALAEGQFAIARIIFRGNIAKDTTDVKFSVKDMSILELVPTTDPIFTEVKALKATEEGKPTILTAVVTTAGKDITETKTVYVIGQAGQGQTKVTILPGRNFFLVGESITYQAIATIGNQAVPVIVANWQLTPASQKGKDPIAIFESETKNIDYVTVSGKKPGQITLNANVGKGGIKTSLDITFLSITPLVKVESRPGIPQNRWDSLGFDILPAGINIDFKIDNEKTAKVNNFLAKQSGLGIYVSIAGISLSKANQDTKLIFSAGGYDCATFPVTVVEPNDYSSTQTMQDNTPSIVLGTSNVEWVNPVIISLLDQFNVVLHSNWDGMFIQESVNSGNWVGFEAGQNQGTLANGIVVDNVRLVRSFDSPEIAQAYINRIIDITGDDYVQDVNQQIRVLLDNGQHKVFNMVNSRMKTLNWATRTYTVTNTH